MTKRSRAGPDLTWVPRKRNSTKSYLVDDLTVPFATNGLFRGEPPAVHHVVTYVFLLLMISTSFFRETKTEKNVLFAIFTMKTKIYLQWTKLYPRNSRRLLEAPTSLRQHRHTTSKFLPFLIGFVLVLKMNMLQKCIKMILLYFDTVSYYTFLTW